MKALSSIYKYFWKYKTRLILGILFILLSNYFRILSPQITGYVVNNVVKTIAQVKNPEKNTQIKNAETSIVLSNDLYDFNSFSFEQKILFSGILLLGLALLSGLFMFFMRQTIIVMSRHIEFDQKNEIYQHYQSLDIGFYKSNATGDLMNRISEDVSRVRMFTGPALMYFFNLAIVIGLSIFFMLQADVKLTLVALCPLPILAFTIYTVNSIINKKSERIQSMLSNLTSNAQESFSGIRVIKSFAQEKAMLSYFKKTNEEYKKNSLSLSKTEAIYFPSMALLIGISTLITIMVGGLAVAQGQEGATVGKIAEFVLYIQMLTFPVSAIGWTASMTQRAVASQTRINEFLNITPSITDSKDALSNKLTGEIGFKNVSFTYPHTGIKAVKDFSLEISSGEKVAIVGKTGSGKSTIAQLLLRMYDVEEGSIAYDGIDIKKFSLNHLRTSISYVPQEVFLFSDSVKNNIQFGKADAIPEEIERAARNANIYDEIMEFPEGFNTIIGERGVTLSGGQKQRISIARAMLKNPEILIFDDCLSAVDSKTEHLILQKLNKYIEQKTAIIITHRIFSLLSFDKIIVLDEGKIAESGNHEELLQKKGIYYKMYLRQQSEGTKDQIN